MLATAVPRVVALCLLMLVAGCPDSDSEPPTEWVPLGTEVDSAPTPTFDRYHPAVAMDPTTDRPVVSLNEKISDPESLIRVKAWSGTAWEELAPTPGVQDPRSSAIAVTSDGTVWLAWTEYDVNPALGQHLHVARWTGAAWDVVGNDLAVGGNDPSMALDSNDQPWIVWSQEGGASLDIRVMRWDGAGWIEVGGGTLGGDSEFEDSAPSIAIGADDHPVVAWDSVTTVDIGAIVVVKQWDGATWNRLGDLGGGVGSNRDRSPSVAFTRGGADCFVSYREHAHTDGEGTADYDLHVERWDGAAWSELGPVIDDSEIYNVEATSIVVDASGLPTVAYSHEGAGSSEVHVSRWTGTAWRPLEDALNGRGNAYDPEVTLDPDEMPIVVWHDNPQGEAHVEARLWTGAP